jgi:lambda repressor-like predicted transcriptional regulator
MSIKQQTDRIKAYIRRPEVNVASLARAAGLHRNTLNGAKSDGWNPKVETLIALEPFVDGTAS